LSESFYLGLLSGRSLQRGPLVVDYFLDNLVLSQIVADHAMRTLS
jgi:hypothetical protein